MRYRAVLNDINDPELQVRGKQVLGDDLTAVQKWGRDVLAGRKRPASVEIFRTSEICCEVIYPKE